ncbi:MAG: MFS transporter [Pseudomonadota bacterium]
MNPANHPAAPGRQRWRLPLALAITVVIAYLDRINITLAMPLIAAQYGWNDAQMQDYGSLLMSLFYVGYGFSGLLLSPWAARIGPRKGITLVIALASLFTALGAIFSQFLLLFMASRVMLGVVEGPHYPLSGMAIRNWFPAAERSRANSLFMAGLFTSVIAGPLLLVPLMDSFGWRATFVVLALAGFAISLPLINRYVFTHPAQDPRLGAKERDWIELAQQAVPGETAEQTGAGPLAAYPLYLVRRRDFQWLFLAGTLNNMVALGLMSWIPTFFTTVMGAEFSSLSWIAALPYLSGLLGLAFWSQVGDRLNQRGLAAGIGYLFVAALMYVSLTGTELTPTLIAMSLAVFSISAFTACEYAFAQRVVPQEHVAAGVGLYNGGAMIVGGGLGPFVASSILEPGGGFSLWLLIALALCTSASMIYLGRRLNY